ncbi:unnamed protein product [Rotaria magnacalcarata]|uniref:Protein kinase domain-containing protein n=2 Tax=Rotaria magnacalcarata TaxID=392030 RepID=A0A815V417_9BILA|nr:unnamed protein product [Rotaria magnacalcarata]CAF2041230.1 unnamed protein product [Rotaria magnacalcarata]CAF3976700.1 unnamed protein product [Rotaria magnacalcarata]CAF4020165.1 unnamed protein product [Rotaria magnacalcarata]
MEPFGNEEYYFFRKTTCADLLLCSTVNMEVSTVVTLIFQGAKQIYEAVQQVKDNKTQSSRLSDRINAVINPLMPYIENPEQIRSTLKLALNNLLTCIEEAKSFISGFSDSNWFIKIFNNGNHKKEFEDLNRRLLECSNDLNLGLNVSQIFDHKQDEHDQKADLCSIDVEDLAQRMLNAQQEEFRKQYTQIDELLQIRFLSFRKQLKNDIEKAKDDGLAKQKRQVEEKFQHLKISISDLVFEDRVGFGSFADVYRGTWKSQSKTVAIKHIRINHLHYNVEQSFCDELGLMYRLRDDNIINVLGACMEPNYYAIVIEYMPLGSVFNVKLNTPFAWPDRWSIALQMAKGINYLHALNPPILHRDIKSMNFLLAKRFDDLIVKVCDFGLSEIKQESARQSKVTDNRTVGSLPWKAPELFTKGGSHTVKSDIYSLGITFWELTSRELPYQEYADDVMILAQVTNGKRLDIPLDTPDSYRSIITIAWDQNPEKRPLCFELIKLIDEAKTTDNNASTLVSSNVVEQQNKEKEKDEYIEQLSADETSPFQKAYSHLVSVTIDRAFA